MNFDFSNEEVLFIYGHFQKEINKLKEAKENPAYPISKVTLNKEIKFYSSIVGKIEKTCPQLVQMKPYLNRI